MKEKEHCNRKSDTCIYITSYSLGHTFCVNTFKYSLPTSKKLNEVIIFVWKVAVQSTRFSVYLLPAWRFTR